MTLKFGKLPARPGAMKLKLADYLKASRLPKAPQSFGDLSAWGHWQWGMLGNDTAGCCVFSGFAHQCMAWNATAGIMNTSFTDAQILGPGAYGETGYVIGNDSTDHGTDMVQACQFWKDKGFFGHTIRGFAEVTPSNAALAAFIFGSAGIGIKVTQAQMAQFSNGGVWDIVEGSPEVGGHYVPVIGCNSLGHLLCVTWGRLQAMTPRFLEAQCDEAVCQISDDWLVKGGTPRGLNLEDLTSDMETMSNA